MKIITRNGQKFRITESLYKELLKENLLLEDDMTANPQTAYNKKNNPSNVLGPDGNPMKSAENNEKNETPKVLGPDGNPMKSTDELKKEEENKLNQSKNEVKDKLNSYSKVVDNMIRSMSNIISDNLFNKIINSTFKKILEKEENEINGENSLEGLKSLNSKYTKEKNNIDNVNKKMRKLFFGTSIRDDISDGDLISAYNNFNEANLKRFCDEVINAMLQTPKINESENDSFDLKRLGQSINTMETVPDTILMKISNESKNINTLDDLNSFLDMDNDNPLIKAYMLSKLGLRFNNLKLKKEIEKREREGQKVSYEDIFDKNNILNDADFMEFIKLNKGTYIDVEKDKEEYKETYNKILDSKKIITEAVEYAKKIALENQDWLEYELGFLKPYNFPSDIEYLFASRTIHESDFFNKALKYMYLTEAYNNNKNLIKPKTNESYENNSIYHHILLEENNKDKEVLKNIQLVIPSDTNEQITKDFVVSHCLFRWLVTSKIASERYLLSRYLYKAVSRKSSDLTISDYEEIEKGGEHVKVYSIKEHGDIIGFISIEKIFRNTRTALKSLSKMFDRDTIKKFLMGKK